MTRNSSKSLQKPTDGRARMVTKSRTVRCPNSPLKPAPHSAPSGPALGLTQHRAPCKAHSAPFLAPAAGLSASAATAAIQQPLVAATPPYPPPGPWIPRFLRCFASSWIVQALVTKHFCLLFNTRISFVASSHHPPLLFFVCKPRLCAVAVFSAAAFLSCPSRVLARHFFDTKSPSFQRHQGKKNRGLPQPSIPHWSGWVSHKVRRLRGYLIGLS